MRYHMLTADVIQNAGKTARHMGHSYVGSEHLLLTLAREPGWQGQLLRGLGLDPDLSEAMTRLLYGMGTPDLPLPQGLTPEAKLLLRSAAREARQELDERIDGSTTQFYKAMDKLLLYGVSDLDRIDIEHLIPVNPEVNVWKFGDAFLRGDAAGMMRYLDELITIERMSHQAVIPLLAYRLRSVYNVVRCDECGMSFDRIEKYTGRRFPERELRSARGMTSKDILALLDRLATLDQQIKNGTVGGKEGFEQFLLGRIKQCSH